MLTWRNSCLKVKQMCLQMCGAGFLLTYVKWFHHLGDVFFSVFGAPGRLISFQECCAQQTCEGRKKQKLYSSQHQVTASTHWHICTNLKPRPKDVEEGIVYYKTGVILWLNNLG